NTCDEAGARPADRVDKLALIGHDDRSPNAKPAQSSVPSHGRLASAAVSNVALSLGSSTFSISAQKWLTSSCSSPCIFWVWYLGSRSEAAGVTILYPSYGRTALTPTGRFERERIGKISVSSVLAAADLEDAIPPLEFWTGFRAKSLPRHFGTDNLAGGGC